MTDINNPTERYTAGEGVLFKAYACLDCKHKDPGLPTCDAFPFGIPAEILNGENDHRKPVEGDNGIRHEKGPVPLPAILRDKTIG